MTAKELIEYLTRVPPDTVVSIPGYEGGIEDVKYTRLTQVLLDVNLEWYYGPHEECEDGDEDMRKRYEARGLSISTEPRVLLRGWAR